MIEIKLQIEAENNTAKIALNSNHKDITVPEMILSQMITNEIKSLMNALAQKSNKAFIAEGKSADILQKQMNKKKKGG